MKWLNTVEEVLALDLRQGALGWMWSHGGELIDHRGRSCGDIRHVLMRQLIDLGHLQKRDESAYYDWVPDPFTPVAPALPERTRCLL